MTTTRLLLVRHGHSQHHVERIAGGPRGDTGLTGPGREQLRRAGARLASWPGLASAPVYCSTLARARQSGELLAEALGSPPPIEHCGLCSYHVLDRFDGRPHTEGWEQARRAVGSRSGGRSTTGATRSPPSCCAPPPPTTRSPNAIRARPS